jgi:hypothetical protein
MDLSSVFWQGHGAGRKIKPQLYMASIHEGGGAGGGGERAEGKKPRIQGLCEVVVVYGEGIHHGLKGDGGGLVVR